jgi:uncharacterized protein YegL
VDARGTGYCAPEDDESRFEAYTCNPQACNDNAVCLSMLDVVLVLDASGSVGYWPYQTQKHFAETVLSRLNFGEMSGKAGVVRFASNVDIVAQMSFDQHGLESEVDHLGWPGSSTNTAQAISTAMSVLSGGGRGDAESIVFIITDGMPNDSAAVDAAARTARQTARLVFVAVGDNLDYDSLVSWASFPAEQNVLYAENFDALFSGLTDYLADMCPDLGCREEFTGRGQDYIGCQTRTRGGKTCQGWTDSYPHMHYYTPANFPNHNLGDFNFCRNPDGDSTIWCVTSDSNQFWDFCDPL